MNNAFEKDSSPKDENEYDSISSALDTGPRRKENVLYESTPTSSPCLPRRKEPWVTDESLSDRSSRTFSSSSGGFLPGKGKAGVSKLGLFFMLVNFLVASAALGLVVLMITGIYGPKCMCKQEQPQAFVSPPQTGMSGNANVQGLQRRILDLEKKTEEMRAEMNKKKVFSNEVRFLQSRISAQERLLNETANKVNLERPTIATGTKLPLAEIDLMNKSINFLKRSDSELKTTVNNLQLSFAAVEGIVVKLTANVSFFETQMQRMRNSSSHLQLSRRVEELKISYAHIASAINTFQRLNSAQNTSLDALRYGYKRLEDGMLAVNATLKKKRSDSELKTTVNNLQLSFAAVEGIVVKLTANVSFFETQMQRMRNSSSHLQLSRRVEELKISYAHIASAINTFQRLNSAQNASLDALRYGYKHLEDGMLAVNATLKKKLDSSAAANFSLCTHMMKKGTPVSPGASACASATYIEPKGKRVMGITCSTDYAHEFFLESSQRKGYYTCKCSGLSDRAKFFHEQPKTINCFINVWECEVNK